MCFGLFLFSLGLVFERATIVDFLSKEKRPQLKKYKKGVDPFRLKGDWLNYEIESGERSYF